LLDLHLEGSDLAGVRILQESLETMQTENAILDCGHIIVLE
jgi:hypothetical protein